MSSVNIPKKSHFEAKVLLRSTSFQKLCSIPYSFKIEAIQSYKEHIKTVIKLLKIATRAYVISIYLKCMTTILFNEYIFKLCAQLQGYYPAAGGDILEASTTVTPNIANVRHSIKTNITNSQKPTILNLIILYKKAILTILTYTCILYIALQIISLLTVLWWSSNIPFGLVFLMLDLSYMGFIMSKIALC
ncbi:AGAP007711-PA [Anopheles gambiae str. PEST]|uniref:AGAP007711-PA n=1 Tax=Anopheles gambiae TaxID=7165 RepID=Q7PTA0_ANOGA|nr:AGAP007711-PA [Anopheles gambiae str. PEST]